jgi:hypothetical protein
MLTSWSDVRSRLGGRVNRKRRAQPAAWSIAYHRLFCERAPEDPAAGSGLLHPAITPEHPSRALDLAVSAYDDGHLYDTQLRLVGNNVLHSTYALDGEGRAAYRKLCCRVENIREEHRWEEAMQQFGQTADLYSKPRARKTVTPERASPLASEPPEAQAGPPAIPTPSADPAHHLRYLDVTFDGRTTTLSFEILLPKAKNDIVARADPRTWAKFDTVHFLETKATSVEVASDNAKRPEDLGAPGVTSWRGKYLERFVLPWNTAMLSLFEVELHVDVSIHSEGARTDYNLYDEANGQLVRDSGFVIVRKMPGNPNWSIITAQKSTAYQSPLMNALNPAMLATWMQDQITTFWTNEESGGRNRRRQAVGEMP